MRRDASCFDVAVATIDRCTDVKEPHCLELGIYMSGGATYLTTIIFVLANSNQIDTKALKQKCFVIRADSEQVTN
jgi:hypothetical protein